MLRENLMYLEVNGLMINQTEKAYTSTTRQECFMKETSKMAFPILMEMLE